MQESGKDGCWYITKGYVLNNQELIWIKSQLYTISELCRVNELFWNVNKHYLQVYNSLLKLTSYIISLMYLTMHFNRAQQTRILNIFYNIFNKRIKFHSKLLRHNLRYWTFRPVYINLRTSKSCKGIGRFFCPCWLGRPIGAMAPLFI